MSQVKSPVAFIIFKRPEETRRVFDAIKKVRPAKLFIVSDGPRNETEADLVKQTRQVVENVDWPCEVKRNYSEKNLGCKLRVSSGLDWVFEQVEEAIILEDDCLPSEQFFQFTSELLDKYQDNPKVMHISGVNFQKPNDNKDLKTSYYFSVIPQIWGWATWRRAWQKNDVLMKNWPNFQSARQLGAWLKDDAIVDYWQYVFERMYQGLYDTWDIAWTFAVMSSEGVAITPKANLISNIGFSASATHSSLNKSTNLANQPAQNLDFPLNHPANLETNRTLDQKTFEAVFGIKDSLKKKIVRFLKNSHPTIYKKLKS